MDVYSFISSYTDDYEISTNESNGAIHSLVIESRNKQIYIWFAIKLDVMVANIYVMNNGHLCKYGYVPISGLSEFLAMEKHMEQYA